MVHTWSFRYEGASLAELTQKSDAERLSNLGACPDVWVAGGVELAKHLFKIGHARVVLASEGTWDVDGDGGCQVELAVMPA